MKRVFIALAVCLCIIAAACAIPFRGGPNKEEMDAADFGLAPTDYEVAIKKWMKDNLRDPLSAQIDEIGQPEKSWWGQLGGLAAARDIRYGWVVMAKINAKNAYGGYIGFKKYWFYFRDGEIKYTQFER
jgi:hypothetical protein